MLDTKSASGVTSLIKVLLIMQQNMVPPHCGIETTNKHNFPFTLKERKVHIAMKSSSWNQVNRKRKAFLNNFNAADGNTAHFYSKVRRLRQLVKVANQPTYSHRRCIRKFTSIAQEQDAIIDRLEEKHSRPITGKSTL